MISDNSVVLLGVATMIFAGIAGVIIGHHFDWMLFGEPHPILWAIIPVGFFGVAGAIFSMGWY